MTLEYANAHGPAEAAIKRAPAHIRAAINKVRRSRGLDPVVAAGPDVSRIRGVGVWWDPASPHRPKKTPVRIAPRQNSARGQLVDRVLLVAAYGDAKAADIGRERPETIARDAFGPAATLNTQRGWGLTVGHRGDFIQFGGTVGDSRLRAHNTDVGLVLEWLPDPTNQRHRDVVREIEAGKLSCSVHMLVEHRHTLRVGQPIDVVLRAKFVSVALVEHPAYAGAVAKIFRACRRDDSAELAQQLAAVAREAKFRENRRWGRAV